MLELRQGELAAGIGENRPVVTQRGTQHGEVALPGSGLVGDVLVAVSCEGPGRFTVESAEKLVLSSACTGRPDATIRLAGDRFGRTVSVTAPGDYWLVVVPTV